MSEHRDSLSTTTVYNVDYVRELIARAECAEARLRESENALAQALGRNEDAAAQCAAMREALDPLVNGDLMGATGMAAVLRAQLLLKESDAGSALLTELKALRDEHHIVQAWRALRMEYTALSASVQERFRDLGRPPGFSSWNEDERNRHTWLLVEMLKRLNELESSDALARLDAARTEAER